VASRKKLPADMRTVGLFSGKTKQEEVEDMVREEEAAAPRRGDPTAMKEHAEQNAIRWLGLDSFHEGDDVSLALHPKGHGVLILTAVKNGKPYRTIQMKVTKDQVKKLKIIAKEIP
jgi:hypothetical protein